MQKILIYVNARDTLGVVRDEANAKTVAPPTLVRGAQYMLIVRLFADTDTTETIPLEAFATVESWSWSMDVDYDLDTTCKIIGDAAGITLSQADSVTEISIPITQTNTEELIAAMGDNSTIKLKGELCGYTADTALAFVLQIEGFTIRGRISGAGDTTPVDSGYITATQAAAMIGARQGCRAYTAGAEVCIAGKVSEYLYCVSGGITAAAAPDFSAVNVGASTVDGTVTWEKRALGQALTAGAGIVISGGVISTDLTYENNGAV